MRVKIYNTIQVCHDFRRLKGFEDVLSQLKITHYDDSDLAYERLLYLSF